MTEPNLDADLGNPTVPTLQPGVCIVSAFTGFEPFIFYRDGELVGFDVDILESFCAKHELAIEFAATPRFEGVWFKPGDNESDVAAAGIARFDKRTAPSIAWTRPYFEVNRSILVHMNRNNELGDIDSFAGKSLAFVQGSSADIDARERAPRDAHLVPVENQQQGLALLRAGTIDGLAMGSPSNAFNATANPEFCLIDVHAMAQPEHLRFTVNASNKRLLSALDRFIIDAESSGEIRTYFERWMSDRI